MGGKKGKYQVLVGMKQMLGSVELGMPLSFGESDVKAKYGWFWFGLFVLL